MSEVSKFRLMNSYNRLVRSYKANPIECGCGAPGHMISRIGSLEDEPFMECFVCGSRKVLGLNEWQRIEAVVKEN